MSVNKFGVGETRRFARFSEYFEMEERQKRRHFWSSKQGQIRKRHRNNNKRRSLNNKEGLLQYDLRMKIIEIRARKKNILVAERITETVSTEKTDEKISQTTGGSLEKEFVKISEMLENFHF